MGLTMGCKGKYWLTVKNIHAENNTLKKTMWTKRGGKKHNQIDRN